MIAKFIFSLVFLAAVPVMIETTYRVIPCEDPDACPPDQSGDEAP